MICLTLVLHFCSVTNHSMTRNSTRTYEPLELKHHERTLTTTFETKYLLVRMFTVLLFRSIDSIGLELFVRKPNKRKDTKCELR